MTRTARGFALLSARRPDAALEEFLLALGENPNDVAAYIGCAACHTATERWDEAAIAAKRAIELAPDHDGGYAALAEVEIHRSRWKEAIALSSEALRLDSGDPDNHARLARALAGGGKWSEACAVADAGLAIDPEHLGCSNVRSIALIHTGRRDAAAEMAEATLRFAPENSALHTTRGIAALHQGKHRDARRHFQEALRIDPENEAARDGLVVAIKATWPVYRWWVDWSLWMSRLGRRAGLFLILGAYVLSRVLRALAKEFPAAEPWISPILYLYIAIIVVSWVADPIANVLLLLHPVGRHALSRRARLQSIAVASLLGVALGLGIWAWSARSDTALLGALVSIGLVIPVVAFHAAGRSGVARIVFGAWLGIVAAVGLAAVAFAAGAVDGPAGDSCRVFAIGAFTAFAIGVVATTWVNLAVQFFRRGG